MLATAVFVVAFSACTATETEADRNVKELTNYVDSVKNLTPVYTSENWAELERGYQERVVLLENDIESLEEEQKVKLEESMTTYKEIKNSYVESIKAVETATANAASDYRATLRNSLFGAGTVGNDISFGFVNENNLLDVFTKFVNTVQDNKDVYTREDWDEIKVLYEALNTRKNTVEKDLPKGHNMEIAGLKIKFAALKATNRGGTKAEENRAAKEKS